MAPLRVMIATLLIAASATTLFQSSSVRAQDDAADADADADEGSSGPGKLIVAKSFDSEHVAEGLELNVDVTLFNVGEGSVYEVSLKDEVSSGALKLIQGGPSAEWPEIPAGENVKHSYKVQVVSSGTIAIDAATVSYKATPTSSAITAKSSVPLLSDGPGTGNVLGADEYARNHGDHKFEFIGLAVLIAGLVYVPYKNANAAYAELNSEADAGKKTKGGKKSN